MGIFRKLISVSFAVILIFSFSLPLLGDDSVYLEEDQDADSNFQDRDQLLSTRQDIYQVPPDQLGYQNFEPYGHWVETAEYGNVWVPDVDPDWVPFRDGRWIWNPYYGWVWVSYEPWGWRPFHYGRWIRLDFEGWAWIPGPEVQEWSPGVVRWIWTPYQIGWVPLAPGEIYYPFYYSRRIHTPPINAVQVPKSVTYLNRNRLIRSIDPRPLIPIPRGSNFVPATPPSSHRIIAGPGHERVAPFSGTNSQIQANPPSSRMIQKPSPSRGKGSSMSPSQQGSPSQEIRREGQGPENRRSIR